MSFFLSLPVVCRPRFGRCGICLREVRKREESHLILYVFFSLRSVLCAPSLQGKFVAKSTSTEDGEWEARVISA